MQKKYFSRLTNGEKEILFEALLHCLESNSGIGFPRYDQQHPDYHDGATGQNPPPLADNEKQNRLFHFLRELSLELSDHHPVTIHRRFGITTWEQFCQRAIAAGEKTNKQYIPLHLREHFKNHRQS
jgi:hypothetical protein